MATPKRKSASPANDDEDTFAAYGSAPADGAREDARTTFGAVVRMYRLHQILFEQAERDNGVRQWVTMEWLMAEFETSDRTIRNTFDRMRYDFGLPVHYVEKRKGFGYTEPVSQFPTLIYNRAECLALCIAMQASAVYAGTSYAKHVRSVVRKLTAGLRKEMAVEFQALERVVTFHCTGADSFIPLQNFEVITPALIHRQELEINYATAHREDEPLDGSRDAEAGIRRIEPLHLACIDFGWYLFAYDPRHSDVRTFALRRIRELRMTGVTCEPRRFNVRKELADSFGAFGKARPETIRLRFWGRAARIIPEFFWHKSQVITPVPGQPGTIDLTLRVAINPRFVGWICEWLREVAVLEPVALRHTLIQSCELYMENQRRVAKEWDDRP